MKSEFESREVFECIFGGEGVIDLSKDETGEYSFQPSRFAYSSFLVAWQYRQTEVNELTLQVAEMKSRLNDAYTDGQSAMYTARQSKIDELQKENAALVHVIKSRDIQLENEKHEYDELMNKLVDGRMKNKELQKRVDEVKREVCTFSEFIKRFDEHTDTATTMGTLDSFIDGLEQAIKGGESCQ